MMTWFEKDAPIRQKTKIAFGSLVAMMAAIQLLALFGPGWITIGLGLAIIAGAAWLSHQYREAICVPYVNTVVRMEGLAAGDLDSPIVYTEYKDCVGRMTKAMMTFRDTAVQQQLSAAEQAEVVRVLGQSLARMKGGDLTADIETAFPASYAELRTNYNEAIASLRTLIGSVAASTETIRTGSSEIAQASENLARRTEANAASLEQTSAAVGQMDNRLKATANAATDTVQRADGAIHSVTSGRTIADEAVQAMTRVAESAKGIDSVIEGLDKIAFQTRVLAMNAAVEAGRAGEAGRGFAVVADLVSALAMRSEEEASRARDQLTTTQTDIVSAVEMVQKVDAALVDIANDVGEVHGLLGGMAADNQAQSSAITQVNAAIGQMEQATQQNAAMVEQTSAAARNLSSEVNALAAQASQFVIGTDTGPARRTDPRPAPARPAPSAYVSPVKPLSGAKANGAAAAAVEDWNAF